MEDNNDTLILNTTAIDSLCTQYNEKINTLGQSYENIANDFQAFLNCGVLTSYIPDLKNSIDQVVLALDYIVNSVKTFAEEQEKIENYSGYERGGNNSYGKSETPEEEEILSESDYNKLFNNDEFLAALVSIVQENPDILTNESKCELLKELLLKSGITDEEILKILNENDSKAIQTTIYKMLAGELTLLETNDKLDEIKKILLSSLVKGSGSESGVYIEVDSDVTEGGQYVRKTFTASNGVEVEYYVYLPTTVKGDKEIPMHLFLWPTRSQGPGGYFNVHGLPALLRSGQAASGIVICPRLGANEKYTNSMMKALKELMDSYAKEFNVDKDRISVSGQGGGGQAAVNIATKYPDYFSKVAGLYSSAATSDYENYASSKEQAELNVASNDILLIKSRGGGDELNTRSAQYTDKLYNKLSKHDNVDVMDNPSPGDLYGHYLYQDPFTYDGKKYKNFLEYMFAQTK